MTTELEVKDRIHFKITESNWELVAWLTERNPALVRASIGTYLVWYGEVGESPYYMFEGVPTYPIRVISDGYFVQHMS